LVVIQHRNAGQVSKGREGSLVVIQRAKPLAHSRLHLPGRWGPLSRRRRRPCRTRLRASRRGGRAEVSPGRGPATEMLIWFPKGTKALWSMGFQGERDFSLWRPFQVSSVALRAMEDKSHAGKGRAQRLQMPGHALVIVTTRFVTAHPPTPKATEGKGAAIGQTAFDMPACPMSRRDATGTRSGFPCQDGVV